MSNSYSMAVFVQCNFDCNGMCIVNSFFDAVRKYKHQQKPHFKQDTFFLSLLRLFLLYIVQFFKQSKTYVQNPKVLNQKGSIVDFKVLKEVNPSERRIIYQTIAQYII